MIIGKDEGEIFSELKNGKIKQMKEACHLGMWYDETGKYSINIQKHAWTVESVIKKINQMASESNNIS